MLPELLRNPQSLSIPLPEELLNVPLTGLGLECAYCWKISDPNRIRMDLHEVIWWRSDVQSSDINIQMLIQDCCNCAYVHQSCHPFSQSGEGQIRAIVHLIRYEGVVNIHRFNRLIGTKVPSLAHEKASRILQAWDLLDSIIVRGAYNQEWENRR